MSAQMVRRIAVAAVGIPTALGLVRVGGWPLVAALAVLAALGALELFRLAEVRDVRPFRWLGAAAAAATPAGVYLLIQRPAAGLLAVAVSGVGLTLVVMAAAVLRRPPAAGPLAAVAVTLVAPVYTGLFPSFVLVLRHVPPQGPWAATWLVFLPLAVVWICDSAAMAAGSAIGGPKFAPTVSPNKTWAGTVAGSLAGGLAALAFGLTFLARTGVALGPGFLIGFGLLVASVGQIGDLAESLFKREAGVKDSGTVFPGHGGVLDRLDSLYWALPAAALLLTLAGVL